jgi:hypothetical protein
MRVNFTNNQILIQYYKVKLHERCKNVVFFNVGAFDEDLVFVLIHQYTKKEANDR